MFNESQHVRIGKNNKSPKFDSNNKAAADMPFLVEKIVSLVEERMRKGIGVQQRGIGNEIVQESGFGFNLKSKRAGQIVGGK